MSILSDAEIRDLAQKGMIEPFVDGQIKTLNGERALSFGLSSYGYDIRCADEFKVFTNVNNVLIDPKNFDKNSFVDVRGEYCIVPPNSFVLARSIEYFRIPRDVLTVCLSKSTYARCFTGDTRVALCGGKSATFKEMVKISEDGGSLFGYAINQDGETVIAPLRNPRLIGTENVIEVHLDNHKVIKSTPDHRFMTTGGNFVEAKDLKVGQYLRSLNIGGIGRTVGGSLCKVRGVVDNKEVADVYCLTVHEHGNFALDDGVFVKNCGLQTLCTPFEPEWEGYVTLEFANTTPLPIKLYANEGCAQILFFQGNKPCEVSYKDRGGKYQGQIGVTLPMT